MTDQLPRPIEPGDVQPGDTIERGFAVEGCNITQRMTVAAVTGLFAHSSGGYVMQLHGGQLTLLARPTPAPAVGSRWRLPEDGSEFVYTDEGQYFCYSHLRFGLFPGRDDEIIARLTPIPDHGDGCSAWLWDPETDTGWVAGKVNGEIDYLQVHGPLQRGGWLSLNNDGAPDFARRLRPWSERGQANG